jgi:TatD DNase family protein
MTQPDSDIRSAGVPQRFVDTHCHLDDQAFSGDLEDVLARSRQAGVTRWINVGFNPDRWAASIALAERYDGMAFMLGVHPGYAGCWSGTVPSVLERTIAVNRPVAIGEIGLDFFRGETNIDQQRQAFNDQLDLAIATSLPVVIHMRDAEEQVLETLTARRHLPRLLFHSFDGSAALTDWVIANGASVGVGGLATRSKSTGLRDQLTRLPIDRLVLETDSPYLVPNGFKHRRNTPESIPRIAAILGTLLNRQLADIAMHTTANAERFFERPPAP